VSERRQEEEDERMEGGTRGAGKGGERRVARRAGGNETEEGTSEKENTLSCSREGGREGRERVDKGQHAGRK